MEKRFEEILEEKPTLKELCEYIRIGDAWYQLGIQLDVDHRSLDDIHMVPKDYIYKTARMFALWLSTNSHATRRQVIDALKREAVKQIAIAYEYEEALKKSYISSGNDVKLSLIKAGRRLQIYIDELSKCHIDPVKVSQLLYSGKCISEVTLDEMETLEDGLDEKKTTLLSAIHVEVSSDYKKLKVLATVLSKFEETKMLSQRIISEYDQVFPDDQMTEIQDVATSYTSPEDCASDILRCHYGTLSQSFKYPVRVAQLLHGERIINWSVVEDEQHFLSNEKAILLVLKKIRHAVHTNYQNLVLFANVLLKQTSNVLCGMAIIKDCVKEIPFLVPRKLDTVFGNIRMKFGIMFDKIREIINAHPPPLDKLKIYLSDTYSHFKAEIAHCKSVNDVLNVVHGHCTLINIRCLEGIVERYDIKEANACIQKYKDDIKMFCEQTKASLCLNESFEVIKIYSLLKCETAIFVFDWDPEDYTLEDIREIIAESVEKIVQIRVIKRGQSTRVICFFPLCLMMLLVARVQETLEDMMKKGLIQLTVGYCTIYYRYKEVRAVVEENTKELIIRLELQQSISKKMTMEIESMNEGSDVKLPAIKASRIQAYIDELLKCLVDPVKVSQFLYSERFISETTLDEMETLEDTLEKKTTLLSAIHTAVSSDHKKLKLLATVLSKFKETKHLSKRINDDQIKTDNVQVVAMTDHSDQISHEYHACDSMQDEHAMEGSMEFEESNEMGKLDMLIRKQPLEDKEESEEELKQLQKRERLDLEATSDTNVQMSSNYMTTAAFNVQEPSYSDDDCREDHASDILRYHYGTLSQSLQYPISVTRLLHEVGVISESILDRMETCKQPVTLLLNAVRKAVHNNYKNLKVFANVLQRHVDNIQLGDAIMKDYDQSFDTLRDNTSDNAQVGILVPLHMQLTFHSMRIKFGTTFNKVREAIKETPLTIKELKCYLLDCYPELTPQLSHPSINTIDSILDIVKEKCTLIDIYILEAIANRFDIKEAETYIKDYEDAIDEFCRTVSIGLCLQESLEVTKSSSLNCETAKFVLEWNPDKTSLADVRELLSVAFKRLKKRVKVIVVRDGNSIIVTCTFPLSLLGVIIAKAQETLKLVKKKGLLKLTIGYDIIYDKHQRDKEIGIKVLRTPQQESRPVRDDGTMTIESTEETRQESRYLPPVNYELLIIGSYGEVSNSIIVARKCIPIDQKGSNEWMKKEIDQIREKHEKSHFCVNVSVYSELPGNNKQHSKDYYLEKMKNFFNNCKCEKAIIFYTGHGETNTGNWCFKDGIITFQDILKLYEDNFKGKLLTINSDCSYSGNWIKDCAKALDDRSISSCGHHTRKAGILLNVWCSCDVEEEATALCYVNEAIQFDEDKKSVMTDFNTKLTSGQNTKLGDFRQIRCSQTMYDQCGVKLDTKYTWIDRVFPKSHLVHLVRSKMWQYVQVDEDKVDEFKSQIDKGIVNVADYGKVLLTGWGQDPPQQVIHQMGLKLD